MGWPSSWRGWWLSKGSSRTSRYGTSPNARTFTSMRLRRLTGARDEFLLAATAQNLMPMADVLGTGLPAATAISCSLQR